MKVVSRRELVIGSTCLVTGLVILLGELVAARAAASAVADDDYLLAAVAAIQPLPDTGEDLAAVDQPAVSEPVASVKKAVCSGRDFLVDAIVQIESGGQTRMVGRAGERGLMQIKRETWGDVTRSLYGRPVGFDQAFNPGLNRRVGSAYLAYLRGFLQEYRTQWKADERSLLLACYNAGPNRVKQAGFNLRQLPTRTRDYVQRASALHDYYLKLRAMDLELAAGPEKDRNS